MIFLKITTLCENHLYSKAYSKGKRAVSKAVAVHILPDYKAKALRKAHPEKITVNRVGLTVSKKIGGAVERTRAKRIMRAAYRQIITENKVKTGFLIVMVARPAIIGMKSNELAKELKTNFDKLGMILGIYE